MNTDFGKAGVFDVEASAFWGGGAADVFGGGAADVFGGGAADVFGGLGFGGGTAGA